MYYSNIEVIHAVCKSKLSAGIKRESWYYYEAEEGQSVDMRGLRGQRYTKRNNEGTKKRASIRKSREHETRIEWTKAVSKDCFFSVI